MVIFLWAPALLLLLLRLLLSVGVDVTAVAAAVVAAAVDDDNECSLVVVAVCDRTMLISFTGVVWCQIFCRPISSGKGCVCDFDTICGRYVLGFRPCFITVSFAACDKMEFE